MVEKHTGTRSTKFYDEILAPAARSSAFAVDRFSGTPQLLSSGGSRFMKKSLIIPLLVAVAAFSSCSRHHVGSTASTGVSQSVSNSAADSTNSVSAPIKFVHVAVVEAETVERIRSLNYWNSLRNSTNAAPTEFHQQSRPNNRIKSMICGRHASESVIDTNLET